MSLVLLIAIPLLAGVLSSLWIRKANAISAVSIASVFAVTLYAYFWGESRTGLEDFWLVEYQASWFHLGLDGLSFVLLLTSGLVAALAAILSWEKPKEQFFLLTTLSGLIGLLLSVDLFAFFIFWELMLIPIYFWVLAYGKERRIFAALQFIIFTQISGLVLLASIVALFSYTGTLDINQLTELSLPKNVELWIASGFTLAFLIKLPAFPLHTWMPSLFRDAPIPAILAGLLVKTGAYGFLRFVLPLFPQSSQRLAPFMIFLGAIGVIYGALLAFSQKNPRKVLAYSTLSHASLILMGLFSNNLLALSGVIVLVVTHALASAGLFIALEAHFGFSLFFAMALLGLPGLGNFVGELLLLFGLFGQHPWAAIIGASSLVLGAAYMLRLIIQLYYGSPKPNSLTRVPILACSCIAVILLWIGLFPAPLLDLVIPTWTDTNADPIQESIPEEEVPAEGESTT
ncbi:MAG: NADH-quinone oxidoreductase subunit M [Myxococcaceae bacterium]